MRRILLIFIVLFLVINCKCQDFQKIKTIDSLVQLIATNNKLNSKSIIDNKDSNSKSTIIFQSDIDNKLKSIQWSIESTTFKRIINLYFDRDNVIQIHSLDKSYLNCDKIFYIFQKELIWTSNDCKSRLNFKEYMDIAEGFKKMYLKISKTS